MPSDFILFFHQITCFFSQIGIFMWFSSKNLLKDGSLLSRFFFEFIRSNFSITFLRFSLRIRSIRLHSFLLTLCFDEGRWAHFHSNFFFVGRACAIHHKRFEEMGEKRKEKKKKPLNSLPSHLQLSVIRRSYVPPNQKTGRCRFLLAGNEITAGTKDNQA